MTDHIHDEHCDHKHEAGINWQLVQGWVQTGILIIMGLYFIDLALPGGQLGNYINVDNFGWLTWVGAAIFLSMGIINAADLLRTRPEEHHHDHSHEHDHEHASAGSLSSWIFLGIATIPLIFGLGVPSKPLSADAISGDLSTNVSTINFGTSQSSIDIPSEQRNILDWIKAFSQSSDLREFEGQAVDVIGFVYKDAQLRGTDDFMVVRFTMSCCVADARPFGLVVDFPTGQEFSQDTWIQVKGHIEIRSIDGIDTPVILADSVEVTSQPEQPYLYF
ncbi:MAG: TIGR03943 family protein [Anaerolineae bacterium]|nr:TIGR03943 family protein [Anaerolineae bacterium]